MVKHNSQLPSPTTHSHWLRKLVLALFSLLLLGGLIFLYLAYSYLDGELPDVTNLKDARLPVPMRIYSSDGKLLAEFGEIRSSPVAYDQIPKDLINAVLATEDQHFFEHGGVDFTGLARAAVELALTGSKTQGGSTITMQVARNFYLTRKKTFMRKINEILLAMKIDHELSKEKILELYLNKIYLGNRAYGVAAAAQVYYGLPLNQLTLPQLAMIAGLPKAPSAINPIANPIAAKKRRNHVLQRMYELEYIPNQAYQDAIKAPLTGSYHGAKIDVTAPYVAETVRNVMVSQFSDQAYTSGYRVYTTINSTQQQAANTALRNALIAYDRRRGYRGVDKNLGDPEESSLIDWREALHSIASVDGIQPAAIITVDADSATALLRDGQVVTITAPGVAWVKSGKPHVDTVLEPGDVVRVMATPGGGWELAQVPKVQGAIVALNPQDGAITAMVGGFGYTNGSFNRAVQAQRQPGSNFKPFIYAAALERGFTLASIFNDAPIVINDPSRAEAWRPQNDKNQYNGPTRLRDALIHSRNLVSIRVLAATGVSYAIQYASRFGFDLQRLPYGLSLALGTATVTPLELATGYAVFANGGFKVSPYLVDHITDENGKVIYQAKPKVACLNQALTEAPGEALPVECAPEVVTPQVAYMMTSAMKDVIRYGTGRGALILHRNDIAGKTGTTNDKKDGWFSGFNGDVATTVWVGYDQPQPLKEYGAQVALPIWNSFMEKALSGRPEHSMMQPIGLVTALIDPKSGLLARQNQDNAMMEYFYPNKVPTSIAPLVVEDTSLDEENVDDTMPASTAAQNANEAGDAQKQVADKGDDEEDDEDTQAIEHLY